MGMSRMEIVPAQRGEKGACTVKELAAQPISEQATIASAFTGEQLPVPEASLRNYVRNHVHELSGEDAYLALVIHDQPDPGEPLRRQAPPGWTRHPVQQE